MLVSFTLLVVALSAPYDIFIFTFGHLLIETKSISQFVVRSGFWNINAVGGSSRWYSYMDDTFALDLSGKKQHCSFDVVSIISMKKINPCTVIATKKIYHVCNFAISALFWWIYDFHWCFGGVLDYNVSSLIIQSHLMCLTTCHRSDYWHTFSYMIWLKLGNEWLITSAVEHRHGWILTP